MRKPDTIILDGHAYSWRQLCEMRRQQLAAWEQAAPQQPALFEIKRDRRPDHERSAASRYVEPSLLDFAEIT